MRVVEPASGGKARLHAPAAIQPERIEGAGKGGQALAVRLKGARRAGEGPIQDLGRGAAESVDEAMSTTSPAYRTVSARRMISIPAPGPQRPPAFHRTARTGNANRWPDSVRVLAILVSRSGLGNARRPQNAGSRAHVGAPAVALGANCMSGCPTEEASTAVPSEKNCQAFSARPPVHPPQGQVDVPLVVVKQLVVKDAHQPIRQRIIGGVVPPETLIEMPECPPAGAQPWNHVCPSLRATLNRSGSSAGS